MRTAVNAIPEPFSLTKRRGFCTQLHRIGPDRSTPAQRIARAAGRRRQKRVRHADADRVPRSLAALSCCRRARANATAQEQQRRRRRRSADRHRLSARRRRSRARSCCRTSKWLDVSTNPTGTSGTGTIATSAKPPPTSSRHAEARRRGAGTAQRARRAHGRDHRHAGRRARTPARADGPTID